MHAISSRGAVLVTLGLVALALAIGLARAPANRAANRWLAGFLAVLAGIGFAYVIHLSRLDREWRWLRYLPLAVPLALGPLLYGHVHRLTLGRNPRRLWLHALPGALELAYRLGFFLLPVQRQALLDDGRGRDRLAPLFGLALPVSLALYAVAGLVLLARYRAWLVQARSDDDLFAARWIRDILLILLATLAGEAAIRAAILAGWRVDVFDIYPFQLWLMAVGVYLGVKGQVYALRPFPAIATSAAEPDEQAGKDWLALGEAWQARTRAEGWWREPSLSLAELARRLGTNTSYLSRAVNEGLGLNFSEMINAMRAEAVAGRLDGPGAEDLLDLAFEAGFSSKTSFNRAFRRQHGMSPSDYRTRARS